MKPVLRVSKKLHHQMQEILLVLNSPKSAKKSHLNIRGKKFELSREFESLLSLVASNLEVNQDLVISGPKQYLTTQQAADYLRVSRPTLIKLLEEKSIPVVMVGKHRRVTVESILNLKTEITAKQEQLLTALAKQDQIMGKLEKSRVRHVSKP